MSISKEPFTVRVRIVTTPAGEAPKWVRDGWIGVEFNAVSSIGEILEPRGVLTNKLAADKKETFCVPEDQALCALKKVSVKAHKWWIHAGFPQEDKIFVFNACECREISERQIIPMAVYDLEDPWGAHDNPEWVRDIWEDLN